MYIKHQMICHKCSASQIVVANSYSPQLCSHSRKLRIVAATSEKKPPNTCARDILQLNCYSQASKFMICNCILSFVLVVFFFFLVRANSLAFRMWRQLLLQLLNVWPTRPHHQLLCLASKGFAQWKMICKMLPAAHTHTYIRTLMYVFMWKDPKLREMKSMANASCMGDRARYKRLTSNLLYDCLFAKPVAVVPLATFWAC